MKLRWPISSQKDKMASHNPSFEKDAIVIQSFLRGALCRARVNRMVQKLIDDILLKRKNAAISSRTIEDDDDDSSINVIDDEHNNNNNNSKMDGSSISIDVLDIPLPKNIKDSSKKEPNEDMQESVSDILLKIEANSPKSNKPPTRNFSPVKRNEKPKIDTSVPSPIDPTQTDTQKKICFVKDANLQSNASKRQTDTEKFLQEHEVSIIYSPTYLCDHDGFKCRREKELFDFFFKSLTIDTRFN